VFLHLSQKMAQVKHSYFSGTPQAVRVAVIIFTLLQVSNAEAAVLRGVVADFLTGKPVARARVTIESVGTIQGPIPPPTLTDANGQFVISQLSPGAYLISAQKKGFVRSRFGQRHWNSPGTPIVLEKDSLFSADLKLHRPGAVMGEIVDENHLGLANLTVFAWKSGRTLKVVAGAETDDRGFFRIAGLPPGRYLIRTGAKELEDRQGLLPTFLGGATRAAEATPVDVKLDQEVIKLSIEPRHGRLTNLGGTVTGGPPGKVILYSDTGKHEVAVGPGGEFAIDQLAPGAYDLLAESGSGTGLLAAQARVLLSKEIEIATLQLTPAPQLRVRCEFSAGRLATVQGVSIFARRREDSADSQSQRLACGENLPLLPGNWEFAASAPADMYVAEVRNAVASGDSYDVHIALGQSREVTVVFGSQPGTLSGKVTTIDGEVAIGAPVFLNAVDADLRSRLGGVRMVRSDEKGMYVFSGLAPGRYEVISSFDIQDPGEAQWPLGIGQAVTIDQKGNNKLDIRVQEIGEVVRFGNGA
jgi:Carboxypeptidase regulatory-like domain